MEFEDKLAYGRNYNVYFFDKERKQFIDEWGRKVCPDTNPVRKPEYDKC